VTIDVMTPGAAAVALVEVDIVTLDGLWSVRLRCQR